MCADHQVGDRVAAMLPLLGSKWGALAEFAAVDQEVRIGQYKA